jgi:hypothetical protein
MLEIERCLVYCLTSGVKFRIWAVFEVIAAHSKVGTGMMSSLAVKSREYRKCSTLWSKLR